MDSTKTREDSRAQFEDTPKGWQERWAKEMESSQKMLDKFSEQGDKVLDVYLDVRATTEGTRLNLFHSGINTVRSMLYGQVPKVDFDRRYADPNDDIARVASEIYERMLNADIERPDDDYTAVLRSCLDDRLIPGLGIARVRYEAKFREEEVPAITDPVSGVELAPAYMRSTIESEQAPVDYVHWKDFRWSYARTWHEVRWVAFREWLSYDQLEKRFGEEKAKKVPLKNQYPADSEKDATDAWQKGEVWEVWCKESKHAYWWVEGMDEILEARPDPLKLKNFLPCPRPMLANATTKLLVPKADYILNQDLYKSIDLLQTRIDVLTKAVRVVGVYNKANPEVARVLGEACENQMIPVENWGMFGDNKGLQGSVDWFPLETVVATLDKLRELRGEQIGLLYQVTGLSDIMRGQSEGSDRVSATEQSIKAKFASVRMQALQDEFARFGTDLIRLKGEVVARHFQPETIIQASNIGSTPDAELAMQAVQLIKDEDQFPWRVAVRPESMAMVDYQALQSERTGYLTAVATFMQSAAPIADAIPGSMSTMLQLLQWGLAGFKGSQQIEGVLDRAIAEQKKNPPQPKQDPAMLKAQQDMQLKMQEMQMNAQMQQREAQMKEREMQMDMMAKQVEAQLTAQKQQLEMQQDQERHLQEMMQDQQKFLQEMQQSKQKAEQDAANAKKKLDSKPKPSV